eukprot:gene11243-4063_t
MKNQTQLDYWNDINHSTPLNMTFYKLIHDEEDENIIFRIYQIFTDSENFLKKFLDILKIPKETKNYKLIENKLILHLQSWLTNYFPTDWNENCSELLNKFSEKNQDKQLKVVIQEIKKTISSSKISTKQIIQFDNFNGCFLNDFLQLDDILIAKEISLLSEEYFLRIDYFTLCKVKQWKQFESIKNERNFFDCLTAMTTEFILFQETPEKRVQIYEKFLKIANILFQMSNYDALFAIISGLNSSSIIRLNQTTTLLSTNLQDIKKNISLFLSSGQNYHKLNSLQNLNKEVAIPYMCLMYQSIKFFFDASDHCNSSFNWNRILNIHSKIEFYTTMHSKRFGFQSNERIRNILQTFSKMKFLDQKELYEWSLFQEPRKSISSKMKNQLKKQLIENYMFPREHEREDYLYYYCSEY